jgi:hypothetical protein
MSQCKVHLYGLKPSDINYSTSSNDKISEIPFQRQRQNSLNIVSSIHHVERTALPETDYLNLHIKPLATPTNSVRNNHLFFI